MSEINTHDCDADVDLWSLYKVPKAAIVLTLAKATGINSPNCPGRWNKVHRCVL